MTSIYSITDQSPLSGPGGPVYLVVADETEEFDNALRYASRSARAAVARLAVLYVTGEEGFSPWGGVEERVHAEQRQVAEKFLTKIAAQVQEFHGPEPVLFAGEGDRIETVLKLLEGNPRITKLILGGDTGGRNPGPLVKYFSGNKGMKRLPVPLTIVPDHLTPETIDGFV
jgi:hypothetical protein